MPLHSSQPAAPASLTSGASAAALQGAATLQSYDDAMLGFECADPSLQIERWSPQDTEMDKH